MKELSLEEFRDRAMAMQRARHIFIETGLTKNITRAFEAYQEIFAERERQKFISAQTGFSMDKYERPSCPDCNSPMMFRQVMQNTENIKIQLVCSKCDTVLNDEHDLAWWMENLRRKDGSPKLSQDAKENEQSG